MPRLLEGILEAFTLIIRLDPELIKIVFLSLRVSGAAIIISTLLGFPLGTWLGLKPEKKTALVNKVIYTLMGLPPVVAGLVIYMLLSRMGLLGVLGLLYTPVAMIIAQVTLALPIVTGLTMVGVRSRGKEWRDRPFTRCRAAALCLDRGSGIADFFVGRGGHRFWQGNCRGGGRDDVGRQYRGAHPGDDHGDCSGNEEGEFRVCHRTGANPAITLVCDQCLPLSCSEGGRSPFIILPATPPSLT